MVVFRLLVGIVVVLCMSPVNGILFSMTRNQVELGNPSGTDPVLTMTCTTDVPGDLLYFKIKRETVDGSAWQPIASFTSTGGFIGTGLPSYWTSANVTSSLQGPKSLTIGVQASSLTCDDDRTYQCELAYLNVIINTQTEVQNSSLRIVAMPSKPTLTARNWNTNMPMNTGFNQDNPANMSVGEQVELTCVANIGSDSSITIRWQKSSEVMAGDMIEFTGYKNDGTAIQNSGSNHCTYSRTSTIRYNTTVIDSNRNEQTGLRFACYFLVNQQKTQQMFYIQVADGSGGVPKYDDGTESNSRVTVIVGVIIGVVTCVTITAITFFVVRRYRSKKGTSNSSTERPTRNQFEANNPTGDVSYYNTRDNPMVHLPSNETAAEENIVGGDVHMSVRTNTEATYYNEGSSHNYESLNDQTRDLMTYTSLQQVSSNSTNVETSNMDTGYENLNLRVI